MRISEQDIKRVAAEANIDHRTVRRVYEGKEPRSQAIATAILAAAVKLEIDPPKQKHK